MESLIHKIDTAVASNDYITIQSIFSGNVSTNNNNNSNNEHLLSSASTATTSGSSWLAVGQGEQRSLAAHLVATVVSNPKFMESSMNSLLDTYCKVLQHLPATVEQGADNTLRHALFQHMVSEHEDYAGAAKILSSIRMNDQDGIYQLSPVEKTDIYVKIAECYLAIDEIVESDSAVQKAGVCVEQISNKEQHMTLILRYKSTYARILDANRKFITAATRYHELSQSSTDVIDADDLLHMLGRAATCAILAPSGPQRQRVLSSIVNDPRLSLLDSIPDFATHGTILKKMYTHQIIRPNELVQFDASLAEHQKAVMGDGLSILERAVLEHNMIAVADLYESIYLSELAWILGVTQNKTESLAASMIMDGSILASIDQVDGLLLFSNDESPIEMYDRLVNNFCMELNNVVTNIKANPMFATIEKL